MTSELHCPCSVDDCPERDLRLACPAWLMQADWSVYRVLIITLTMTRGRQACLLIHVVLEAHL